MRTMRYFSSSGIQRSDFNLLYLIEADLIITTVIQFRRPCAFVAGELLRELQCAFVHQIIGYARRSKGVAANLLADTGIACAALHHADCVMSVHRMVCQLPRSSFGSSEEGSLLLLGYACCLDVLMQVLYQIMMGKHLVELAALFVQPNAPLHTALAEVLDRHIHDSAHPREGVDHRAK